VRIKCLGKEREMDKYIQILSKYINVNLDLKEQYEKAISEILEEYGKVVLSEIIKEHEKVRRG
jgi:hypothetical protein